MSAPFIRIPQSSPVPGRAHDFLEEFNRVAADPGLGASLEQLEEDYRTMDPTVGSAYLPSPPIFNLVERLINDDDNKEIWSQLLQNTFCQEYMKKRPKNNTKTLEGFKWYMRQDFLYLVKLCQYEADRGLKTTTTKDFSASIIRVKKSADYGEGLFNTCTAAPPAGLDIKDSVVLETPATPALSDYITLLTGAANNQNWVMSLVALVPCIQSYYLIAVDLYKNSLHEDTPWYELWVKENIKYEDSTKRQKQFFITNYDLWKDQYDEAKRIFRAACQAEIGLWGTALTPPPPP